MFPLEGVSAIPLAGGHLKSRVHLEQTSGKVKVHTPSCPAVL